MIKDWINIIRAMTVIALMTEAASTSETSINFYQTKRRNNPEESFHLDQNRIQKMVLSYYPRGKKNAQRSIK
jgi:hypothetical protein